MEQQQPSKQAIVKATLIALAVAVVLLFTVILPAEYGFDPLHTGAALKLTGIALATPKGAAPTPVAGQASVYRSEAKTYKTDSEDFNLAPGEGVEMKYHLAKGAVMVYGWKADAPLAYEFHGEPDNKPRKDYYESYDLDDKAGKQALYGAFTAPTTGIHGWFWHNKTQKNIQFHLTVAGFFDSAKMMSDGETQDMPVDDAK